MSNQVIAHTNLTNLIEIGQQQLSPFQEKVLEEALKKESGGLSVPMGSGKTFISILLALKQRKTNEPILVITSKSLISSWEYEIKKFFGDKLKYQILHQNHKSFELHRDTILVLTLPSITRQYYTINNISKKFIEYTNNVSQRLVDLYNRIINNRQNNNNNNNNRNPYYNFYKKSKIPYLNSSLIKEENIIGGNILYSIKWSVLIIDEIQKYTNINSLLCQSLCTLVAYNKWGLSGTIFNEPVPEKILGYYLMLDIKDGPQSIPEMINYLHNKNFKGLNQTLVSREKNEMFIEPKINKIVIEHELSKEEIYVYKIIKQLLLKVQQQLKMQLINNSALRMTLLNMLMYLRQTVLCPLIPITTIALNIFDLKSHSKISSIFMQEISIMTDWLNDINSAKSTRICKILELLRNLNNKTILFSCFRSFIDILKYYIKNEFSENITIFTINPNMSIQKRGTVIEDFKNCTTKAILLLTYDIGAEGLNLQFAQNVIIADFWWNADKTKQAISRVCRYGQIHNEINIYFLTSNTGLERALLKKHQDKILLLDELKYGNPKTKIQKISVNQIINIINKNENFDILNKIYN